MSRASSVSRAYRSRPHLLTSAERGWLTGLARLPANLSHPRTRPRPTKARLAPLFTFCIPAAAKGQIRDTLAHTYGYTMAMLYPDIQGISKRLRDRSDWLAEMASAEH